MLTAQGCKVRRQRLWDRLNPKPDWIVIADPQHLVYFANYYQSPFVFRSNDAGAMLLLGQDGSSILVADNLLQPFCDKAHVDDVMAPTWYRSVESAPHREAFLVKNVLDRLAKCSGRHFGYEAAQVPAGVLEGLRQARSGGVQFTNVDPAIIELKRRKDADELAILRRSMKAGEAGMAAGLAGIRPGMTELEAFVLVQKAALEAVGDQAIVYGDFVSGPRCEEIGGPPSQKKIAKGELFILDFSTVIFQYRADFANTHVVGARPTTRQQELALACLEAMKEGEKVLRAGASGRAVDRAVRGYFEARHLEKNFPHHTGHGIGVGHPEPPFFVPQSADTLVAGDVVTIEPGQYVKGVAGMRFERNYVITDKGYELLSHHAIGLEG
jgi:Xaa-Pro aminopeptidase